MPPKRLLKVLGAKSYSLVLLLLHCNMQADQVLHCLHENENLSL